MRRANYLAEIKFLTYIVEGRKFGYFLSEIPCNTLNNTLRMFIFHKSKILRVGEFLLCEFDNVKLVAREKVKTRKAILINDYFLSLNINYLTLI